MRTWKCCLRKVRKKDKERREVKNGHDGTWVAHHGGNWPWPNLINIPTPNGHSKSVTMYILLNKILSSAEGTVAGEFEKNVCGILYIELVGERDMACI
jgi:malate synthase